MRSALSALARRNCDLIDERRDKEVEHIFNKMGVIHPIRHDGHDICEQTNQEVLSNKTINPYNLTSTLKSL